MPYRTLHSTLAILAALGATMKPLRAFDETQYPDFKGQWLRLGDGRYDPSKPRELGQQTPLTPEYQKIYEDNLIDQRLGGQGVDPTYTCIPDGMPRAMNAVMPMEFVILPKV